MCPQKINICKLQLSLRTLYKCDIYIEVELKICLHACTYIICS